MTPEEYERIRKFFNALTPGSNLNVTVMRNGERVELSPRPPLDAEGHIVKGKGFDRAGSPICVGLDPVFERWI